MNHDNTTLTNYFIQLTSQVSSQQVEIVTTLEEVVVFCSESEKCRFLVGCNDNWLELFDLLSVTGTSCGPPNKRRLTNGRHGSGPGDVTVGYQLWLSFSLSMRLVPGGIPKASAIIPFVGDGLGEAGKRLTPFLRPRLDEELDGADWVIFSVCSTKWG